MVVGTSSFMTTEENKAIIRRFYKEVWNTGRLELVDELVSPSLLTMVLVLRGAMTERRSSTL